ncbi:calcium-binding protein CML42 [Magnolia sinica]|uniref:calcium-binding protein CML42 n=1 Tax=Magnolia sinica TaxID=86752 RepID=UPI002657E4E1|nr:calcium-binding protein CML42 [Magnolia sinica]
MGEEAKPILTRSLSRAAPSFRLRSSSLNALRLRRIFDVFDSNGDGTITIAELSRALERLGLQADPAELEATVQCYMKPGHTGLEYDDFEKLHQSLGDSFFGAADEEDSTSISSCDQEEMDLTEAFKVFDEDGDGFISANELQTVLGKLGLPEAEEMDRVQQMIFSVDRNHDGQVDFHEFKYMMRSISVPGS